MKGLIEKLELYRLENRLTQEALAEKLNVTFATVNRWLNDKSKPSKMKSYQIENLLKK